MRSNTEKVQIVAEEFFPAGRNAIGREDVSVNGKGFHLP